ncbi:hypothetical protein HYV79_01680 [Candidatus Woesearchaeota archaeon]|nr:hypothetical protein [Candidatus Woesearchaeota archaeon]
MKTLVFDAGPIISFTTNNLLHLFPKLKEAYGGKFVITSAVKKELIDKPLITKKFKFEALQVEKIIDENILSVVKDKTVEKKGEKLLALANKCFNAQNTPVKAFQQGEIESLAYACDNNAEAIVIDEFLTRALIENPDAIKEVMEKRLHTKVDVDENALKEFQTQICKIKIIRSIELVTIAFEKGLLNEYVVNLPKAKKTLLESLLWGLKLNGCSVTENEIKEIIKLEKM